MTSFFRYFSLSRFFTLTTTVFFVYALAACGGGAGTVGSPTGQALFTSAASTLTINVETVRYSIGGGTPIYQANSSNTSVATASVSGSTLTIIGLAAGTTQITVTDAVGASVLISITVGSGTTSNALFTTAPSAVSLAVGATSTFTIGGGQPTYLVSTSNAAVATVGINGSTYIITGLATGTAQIIILDATGASVSTSVTVGSATGTTALYTTASSTISMSVGLTNTFTIGGGTLPYTVTSSNTGVTTASVSGATMTVNGIAAGSAQVLVFDGTGASVTIGVTVGSGGATNPLYTTAASDTSIVNGSTVTFTIGGGTAPYLASSSNTGVATTSVTGSTLSITSVAPGSAQILVFDGTGTSVAVTVNVLQVGTSALNVQPNGATGNVGDVLQFLVSGGTPPYSITANNISVATVAPTSVASNGGSLFATLVNAGTTDLTLVDAMGQSKAITLVVSQLPTTLRLSPSAALVGEDLTADIALNIYGGTGPYRAFTSDQTLTSVSTSGNTLTVALGSNGNRCINPIDSSGVRVPNGTFDVTITVLDSLGASATSVVTMKDNGIGDGSVAVQPAPFAEPCQ